jgi:hypothetical protein
MLNIHRYAKEKKGVRVPRKSFTIIDEVHNWGD